jgi:hypothetical protein
MRAAVIIGLIGVILAQAWIRTAWVLDYQWRRSVYLKACENKARPQLRCDGKCYLLKQIKKNESAGDTYPPVSEALCQIKEITLFMEGLHVWEVSALRAEKELMEWLYRFSLPMSPRHGIFHPPEKI